MRSDWQSHCLVITVWWTSIVFRLVETEACWASARSTNANLFHVDIISHCLLSNHNTSDFFFFFFCTMKMFCLGVYFILAQRQAGRSEGTWARSSAWCSTLRFIHLTWFLSDVVKCQKKKKIESTKARTAVSQRLRLFSARVTVNVTWYVSPNPPLLNTSPVIYHDRHHEDIRWTLNFEQQGAPVTCKH